MGENYKAEVFGIRPWKHRRDVAELLHKAQQAKRRERFARTYEKKPPSSPFSLPPLSSSLMSVRVCVAEDDRVLKFNVFSRVMHVSHMNLGTCSIAKQCNNFTSLKQIRVGI